MPEESPLIRLTNAILLSVLTRGATQVRLRAHADHGVVEFLVEGAYQEEMRPPAKLLVSIVRRLSIMARLPIYPRGGSAHGFVHLLIGEYRAAYFAISVAGHGDSMSATLEEITEEEYNRADRTGSIGVYR